MLLKRAASDGTSIDRTALAKFFSFRPDLSPRPDTRGEGPGPFAGNAKFQFGRFMAPQILLEKALRLTDARPITSKTAELHLDLPAWETDPASERETKLVAAGEDRLGPLQSAA